MDKKNMRYLHYCACILVFLALSVASESIIAANTSGVMPVIVDTDMGWDDWIAIPYLLHSPRVEVKAISVVGTGISHCKEGLIHLQQLLDLVGKPDIPIACGKEKPFLGNQAFPKVMRESADQLDNIILPPPSHERKMMLSAVELLNNTIGSSSDKIVLLALGPLTNVADLLRKYPDIGNNIKEIVISGGTISGQGNLNIPNVYKTDNKKAEWNMYADPVAVAIVLNSGLNIVLIPTDITSQFPITMKLASDYKEKGNTKTAKFISNIFEFYRDNNRKGFDGLKLWDPVAVYGSLHLDDNTLVHTELNKLIIDSTYGSDSFGVLIPHEQGALIRIVHSIDKEGFYSSLWQTLNYSAMATTLSH
ncbi:MAG: putative inosine-uridine preferring nucleoside hydrolase [Gammaproteobacteria bacterium]|jgi:inosine-uridine nucleoside N-ribohydrolase|nr:putative inosine-uridine preferring nucleoside hydrolase [Gammaproteobacteria bacterium]